MAKTPIFRMTSGLNNVEEEHRLEYGEDGGCPLAQAVNVVITNGGGVRVRHPKREVRAAASHSFWSRGEYAFFCSAGNLYRLMADETELLVASGVGAAEMSYDFFQGKVYLTNGFYRGIVDGLFLYPWMATIPEQADADTRQLGLPSTFSKIFAHSGRMCLVDGRYVWIGEPFNAGCFDLGAGPISPGGEVTGFASVGDGIYLSTADGISFFRGRNRQEMIRATVHNEPMVPGTCLVTPAAALRLTNFADGLAAVWVSKSGVFAGMKTGEVVNVSDKSLVLPAATRGQACIHDGYYIFSLEVT